MWSLTVISWWNSYLPASVCLTVYLEFIWVPLTGHALSITWNNRGTVAHKQTPCCRCNVIKWLNSLECSVLQIASLNLERTLASCNNCLELRFTICSICFNTATFEVSTTVLLMIRIFWDVKLCRWLSFSFCTSQSLKTKVMHSSETSGNTNPASLPHIPEDRMLL
jgi:hypothetical protein